MANIRKKETVAEVFVTEAELVAMLSDKAKAAGLIDFDADGLDIERSSEPTPEDGDIQGWRVVFRVAT